MFLVLYIGSSDRLFNVLNFSDFRRSDSRRSDPLPIKIMSTSMKSNVPLVNENKLYKQNEESQTWWNTNLFKASKSLFSLSSALLIVSIESRSLTDEVCPNRASLRSLSCFSRDFCWVSKKMFKSLPASPIGTGLETGSSGWDELADFTASERLVEIWLISWSLLEISLLALTI